MRLGKDVDINEGEKVSEKDKKQCTFDRKGYCRESETCVFSIQIQFAKYILNQEPAGQLSAVKETQRSAATEITVSEVNRAYLLCSQSLYN